LLSCSSATEDCVTRYKLPVTDLVTKTVNNGRREFVLLHDCVVWRKEYQRPCTGRGAAMAPIQATCASQVRRPPVPTLQLCGSHHAATGLLQAQDLLRTCYHPIHHAITTGTAHRGETQQQTSHVLCQQADETSGVCCSILSRSKLQMVAASAARRPGRDKNDLCRAMSELSMAHRGETQKQTSRSNDTYCVNKPTETSCVCLLSRSCPEANYKWSPQARHDDETRTTCV